MFNDICPSTGQREHVIIEWINKSTIEITCNVHHTSMEEKPTGERKYWLMYNLDNYGIFTDADFEKIPNSYQKA